MLIILTLSLLGNRLVIKVNTLHYDSMLSKDRNKMLAIFAWCYEAFLKLGAPISGTGRRFFITRKIAVNRDKTG